MQETWDERYRSTEYIYGVEPNSFFAECLSELPPSTILLPADGEGRNGVHAASQGWKVDAFDFSREAIQKAMALASLKQLELNFFVANLKSYTPAPESYDVIALIFVHMPEQMRRQTHQKLIEALRPGGTLILEAYDKSQLENNSGGPRSIELLYSVEELSEDFKDMEIIRLEKVQREITEGKLHKGIGISVQVLAKKKR